MESDVRIPPFVDVLREVTQQPSYDSYLLASELAKQVGTAAPRPHESPSLRVEKQISSVLASLEEQASAASSIRATSFAATFAQRLSSPGGGGEGGGGLLSRARSD